MALLQVKSVSLSFGGIEALSNVSFNVENRQIYSLIGPNGAGKSTLFNCISGLYHPNHGTLLFDEKDITKLKPYKIARLGLARTFQNIELYRGMTVLDNILLGRHFRLRSGVLAAGFYYGKAQNEEVESRELAERIIEFLEIENTRKAYVGQLPYGIQKRIEVGRALAMEPKMIILDEPMAGMNQEEAEDMARFIVDMRDVMGLTLLLIEHDMNVVMDISDQISVLNFGVKIAEGKADEVRNNVDVIAAYLGDEGNDFLQEETA
jgi:branched-chain amino acid transport system ATP-binding protein